MLRGTHNGQWRGEEAWVGGDATHGEWGSRNLVLRKEGDTGEAQGLISPKLLIKPRERERERGRRREERMKEEEARSV